MRNRSRVALLGFAISALLLVAALGSLTRFALRSERSARVARQRAAFEEDVRLALWRVDATAAAFLAKESSRPIDRFFSSRPSDLDEESSLLKGRFEIEAGGRARPGGAEPPDWLAAWLEEDRLRVGPPSPLKEHPVAAPTRAPEADPARSSAFAPTKEVVPPPTPNSTEDIWEVLGETPGVVVDRQRRAEARQDPETQGLLNTTEFQQRAELGSQAVYLGPLTPDEAEEGSDRSQARAAPPSEARATQAGTPTASPPVATLQPTVVRATRASPEPIAPSYIREPLTALWVDDQLILRRKVVVAGHSLEQVSWLDWPQLAEFLAAQARGVLPRASFAPAAKQAQVDPGRLLALLPLRLDPGPAAAAEGPAFSVLSPTGGTLAAAWGATALSLVGVGSLLWGSLRLSRRREEFVSAVTHELRTPLTTFRLYSEMLSEGMVPEDERQSYADVLNRQAKRLGHLVDNVLGFSRLEKGKWAAPRVVLLEHVLDPVLPLLAERAAEVGLELTVDLPPEIAATPLRVDRERLERILFNLVDNASKYAADVEPPRIELRAARRGRQLVLSVRDHGTGVPRGQRRNLFRPFHKSAEHAAGTAPGVGLGLSLARRLARGLGGDLALGSVEAGRGAVFELRLPVDRKRETRKLSGETRKGGGR